jgi:protein-S-isoprenylcysteine O-methyltransferase Ste14
MRHFKVENEGSRFGKRFLTLVGSLTLAIILGTWLAAGEESIPVLVASATLSLSAIALFYWATRQSSVGALGFAGTSEATKSLIQSGPYRYVRHPIYLAYILGWLGLALNSGHVAGVAAGIYLSAIYVFIAHQEEEQFVREGDTVDYRAYRERTGMFLPRFS